jgi:hypothetical protein
MYAIKMAINGSEINLGPLLLGELQLRSFNFPLERPFCNNEGDAAATAACIYSDTAR